MKKLLVLLLCALPAIAQNFSGRSGGDVFVLPPYRLCLGEDNGQNACLIQSGVNAVTMSGALDFKVTAKTVALLPAASLNAGRIYRVTDGQSNADCTVGGGSTMAVCISNGGTWVSMGSGGGGNVSTTPVSDQIITQPIGTQFATNNIANSRVVTASYNWSNSPGGSYTGGTPATLSLGSCPAGVYGNDATLWLYISGGTGTAEAVQSAGTGTGSPGSACTINFTPVNSHSGAFIVGSASQGMYEAMKDVNNINSNIYLVPAGTPASAQTNVYTIQGTITVPSANMTVWAGGAVLKCNSRGPCIKVGISGNGFTLYDARFSAARSPLSATISNLSCSSNTASFTVGNGTGQIVTGDTVMIQKTANSRYWGGPWGPVTANATTVTFSDPGCSVASTPSPGYMIIDNSAVESSPNNPGTHIIDPEFNQLGGSSGAFSNELVALNDQDFRVTQMNTAGLGNDGLQCTTGNYCGAAIFAPGPFSTNPAVVDVSHSNISMNCKGDGIVDWGGNSLNVDSTIIQGTSTTGIFAGPVRGGLVGSKISGLYQENGGTCVNPDYPSGAGAAGQGIMDYGRPIIITGLIGANGWIPTLSGFTSGSQEYWYWIVWHDSGGAVSRPMLAATALSSTGTGSPVVLWPRVMDVATTTYDVIRTAASGPGFLATPTTGACAGGSPLACGSVATGVAQCGTLTCSFIDNLANSTTSYAVPTSASTSSPTFWFWPGNIVVQNGGSVVNVDVNNPVAQTGLGGATTNLNGGDIPTGIPDLSSSYEGYRTSHNYSSGTLIRNSSGNSGRGPNASESIKGRLNFYNSTSVGADPFSDIITLVDSTPEITLTDPANRPLASAGDTAISLDTLGTITSTGLAFRSPVSLTEYVNSLPDGSSWLERLTAAAKTFKVPITTNSQITSTLTTGTAPLSIASTTPVANLTVSNHPKVQFCGTTTTCSATGDTSAQMVFGSVALSGGTATVTGLSPAFTSTSTYLCIANDVTTIANPSKAVPASASSITVTGTGTDVINYQCVGN